MLDISNRHRIETCAVLYEENEYILIRGDSYVSLIRGLASIAFREQNLEKALTIYPKRLSRLVAKTSSNTKTKCFFRKENTI
jgi:hypothetical protein